MRITIETHIDPQTTEAFLPVYHQTFAHLIELSAVKQSLSDDEFRLFMACDEVLKFTGWDDDGELCAISMVSQKLDLVPWISAPFFAKRFPDHYQRDALFYFLTVLVREERRSEPWARALIEAFGLHCGTVKGTCLFDCCEYNDEVIGVPSIIAGIARKFLDIDEQVVDVQRYYAYEIKQIRTIDLREIKHRDVIDLSVRTKSSQAT
jgi:hypothetical protein